MLVLVVCPENQFCYMATMNGPMRTDVLRLITEPFKKLLARNSTGDTRQFL